MHRTNKVDHRWLKWINRRALLERLMDTARQSRAELSRALGLTKSTVSALVDEMLAEGLLVEGALLPQTIGRPARGLSLHPDGAVAVGVEIGVENTTVLVVDWTGGIRRRLEISCRPESLWAVRLQAVRNELGDVFREFSALLGVGVCVPGIVSGDGRLLRAPNVIWPEGSSVGGALHLEEPIRVENDANAAAFGEAFFRRDARDLVFVMLGNGLGGGLVLDGRLRRGAYGATGEFGHTDHGGETVCSCGRRGCLETEVSLRAALSHYRTIGGRAGHTGELLMLAEQGDPRAHQTLQLLGARLGHLIADLALIYDPESFVVGGAGVEAWALLEDAMRRELAAGAYILPHANLEVRPSRYARLAPSVGAAALMLEPFLVSGGYRGRGPPLAEDGTWEDGEKVTRYRIERGG